MSEHFDPYYKWLAIRPQHQPPNHYRLLGISEFEDDRDVIENAADRQMAHIRSFAAGKHAEVSQKLLNEIAAAKVCLLSAARKAEYDAQLRSQQPRAAQAEPGARQARAPLRHVKPEPKAVHVDARPAPQRRGFVAQPVRTAAPAASRFARRRRQPKWLLPALFTGGGALLLAVLVLAFSGGNSQPLAVNPPLPERPVAVSDPHPPARDAVEPQGAIPASIEPPDPTPAVANGNPSPPPEGPPQPAGEELPNYALRFAAGRRVELQDSAALLAPGEDFTVEAWVRFGDIYSGQNVVGNYALGGSHAELPPGTYGGWSLTASRVPGKLAYGLTTGTNIDAAEFSGPPMGRWVHLAVTCSGGTLRLFEDGKLGDSHDNVRVPPSPFNIFLGNYAAAGMRSHFAGDICGLRISRGVRYAAPTFVPPRHFAVDGDALVVLDFDSRGDTIRDVSGHGHHGIITGAEWIESSAPPEPHPQLAAIAQLPPYALRLSSAGRVELKDTRSLALPMTVEVWVRPDSSNGIQTIFGNVALASQHPQLAGGSSAGWALCTAPFTEGRGVAIMRVAGISADFQGHVVSSLREERWLHVAACLAEGNSLLFVNGERISSPNDWTLAASPIDFALGRSRYSGDRISFDGYIGGLRISRGHRFRLAFEPQGTFDRDDDTLVLLDFSQPHAALIPDRSGNGHDGVLFGAKWVSNQDVGAESSPAAPPSPADDVDRRVALWARSIGASFGVKRAGETRSEFIRMSNPLPDYPFLITQLNLYERPLSDDDLKQLAPLTGLTSLRLDGTPVTGPGMRHLAVLPALRTLSLKRTRVGDEGLKHLAGITGLTFLDLQGTPVGDAGLVHLARLEQLNVLHLGDTETGDAGLSHIATLPRLHTLYLNGSAVTGAGLAEVARLPAIQFLHIGARQCSEAGLTHLAAAAHLNQLNVYDTKLTPRLAERLCALQPLQILNLWSCRLTKETLAAMAGLRQLKSMRLDNCGVSMEDAARLQEALPDCRIEQFEQR